MACGEKKINIGINIRVLEEKHSGIPNFTQSLCRELLKNKKYNYFFFTYKNARVSKNVKSIKNYSIFINILEKIDKRLVNIYFDNIYILKLIRQYKINLYFSPSFILPYYKPRNTIFVTVIHDLSYLKYKNNPLLIYMNLVFYMKTIMPRILHIADRIITDSTFVKKEIIKIYKTKSNKINVIFLGKDKFFKPVNNILELNKIIKKYHIKQNYIYTNATNHERKNIHGLINAYKNCNKFAQYELIITGLLPDENIVELNNYIRTNNLDSKVKFLGFVSKDELKTLYSFAKIFVYPSFEEGFGLPILESTSCGCLPICSNAGSLPEVIGDDNLLFNPRDVNSITEKINEVLNFSKNEYNDHLKLINKHTKNFTWSKATVLYFKIFDNLIKEKLC